MLRAGRHTPRAGTATVWLKETSFREFGGDLVSGRAPHCQVRVFQEGGLAGACPQSHTHFQAAGPWQEYLPEQSFQPIRADNTVQIETPGVQTAEGTLGPLTTIPGTEANHTPPKNSTCGDVNPSCRSARCCSRCCWPCSTSACAC